MSVYKFMAGMVDTIGGDEDNFDPHKHRKIKNPTSYLDTMTHLLKGSIGAGILAMPEATKRLGVLASVITLIVVGFFATYCIQLLIAAQYHLCKRWRRGYMAYPKSMLFAIRDGPPSLRWAARTLYYFVDIVLLLWQLGICTIFLVFVAENVKQVCDFHDFQIPLRHHLCIVLGPTILLNLVKDLKMLSPLSFASNVVTLLGLTLVFFYLVEDDLELGPEKMQIKQWQEIPNFIGTALFALEAVGVVLALEYNMQEPKDFVGICGLFNIGMTVIISLYLLVGVFGYLKYGDVIKSSITLNLPQHEKKAQAAKIIFALAIFLSFPLQNFVAYNILWRRWEKKLESNKCLADYFLRIILVILPWLLAVAVPRLGPFISLFGALCLSMLAMVFPAVMNLCICYCEPTGYGFFNYKLVRDVIILLIGIFILISGVVASVREIIEAEHKDFTAVQNATKLILSHLV